MSSEKAKLKLKIEQAEAAVAHAQKVYDEAEPGPVKFSGLQLLLAKEKALEQWMEKDLLQLRAAAGVSFICGLRHNLLVCFFMQLLKSFNVCSEPFL